MPSVDDLQSLAPDVDRFSAAQWDILRDLLRERGSAPNSYVDAMGISQRPTVPAAAGVKAYGQLFGGVLIDVPRVTWTMPSSMSGYGGANVGVTSGANARLTCQIAGAYLINAELELYGETEDNDGPREFQMQVHKNGSQTFTWSYSHFHVRVTSPIVISGQACVSRIRTLQVDDYLELKVYHTANETVHLRNGRLSIIKVS